MVTNSQGQVAVAYYQTQQKYIQLGNGHEYVFVVRANICLAWVAPEDVQTLLSITKECCGGNRKTIFRLEHEDHVRRWTNGGGR